MADLLTYTLTLNSVRTVYIYFFNFVNERSKGLLKHIKNLGECYLFIFHKLDLKK